MRNVQIIFYFFVFLLLLQNVSYASEGSYISNNIMDNINLWGMFVYNNMIYGYNNSNHWDIFYMNGTFNGTTIEFDSTAYGGGDTNGTAIFRVDDNPPHLMYVTSMNGTAITNYPLTAYNTDPKSIAYNSVNGRLYVTDSGATGDKLIYVYYSNGTYERSIDALGKAIVGITLSSDGKYIYFTTDTRGSTGAKLYKIYENNGTSIINYSLSDMGDYYSTVVDMDDIYFYIVDTYSNRMFKYDYASLSTITIQSPSNITYGINVIDFNITTNTVASQCLYSLDSAENITMSNSSLTTYYAQNSSVSEGYHSVKFYCNDTAGNMNTTAPEIGFTVATVPLTFSGYAQNPTSPNKNQNIQLNVTLSNTSNQVILEWNGTTNYTVTTHNGNEYYFTMINGTSNYTAHNNYTYYWYASNMGNIWNKSIQQNVSIANQVPTTSAPTIIPSIIYNNNPASIMCRNSTTTDLDNDVITFIYNWYKNNVSLNINNINLSNGNYTMNDQLICEIQAYDTYGYSTKYNSSVANVSNRNPAINFNYTYIENGSVDMTPIYGNTIKLNVNVTDSDNNIYGVFFTLLSPNGTKVIDTQNGTVYNTDLWNSTNYTIDAYGSWQINIYVNDTTGLYGSSQWNFTVSLGTLTYIPTSKTYSQKAGQSEVFNVTFSHTGNSNSTINMTLWGDIANSTLFNVDFYKAETNENITGTNFTVEEGVSYILKVNITSSVSLTGNYTGNITFERINDNSKSNFSVTVYTSALIGNVVLTPVIWSISMDSQSQSSTTFNVENTGDYVLTHCNGSISDMTSYDSYNLTDFNVSVGNNTDLLVTVSNVPAGTYTKTLTIECIATPNGGIDTSTATVSASIRQYVSSSSSSSGGGGGGSAPMTPSVCGNSICEWDEVGYKTNSTSLKYCVQDCVALQGNKTIMFDTVPKYFVVASSKNMYKRISFSILNPQSEEFTMKLYIECVGEDISCTWSSLDVDGNVTSYTINTNSDGSIKYGFTPIYVTVPGGNNILPGQKIVDVLIQTPEDDNDILNSMYEFNVVIENQNYAYKAVMPIKLDFRLGILAVLWDTIMRIWWSADVVLYSFSEGRSLPLLGDSLRLGHIYFIVIIAVIVFIIYRTYRYALSKTKKSDYNVNFGV